MTRPCLVPQAFDAQVLSRPYFRLLRFDPEALVRELAALPCPAMADAKLPADDVEGANTLERLGFLKVCTLIHLTRPVTSADAVRGDLAADDRDDAPAHKGPQGATAPGGEPAGPLTPDPALLDVLAANFRYNRMNLDPFVPPALALAHQRRWLHNTFASAEILKFTGPQALVSFRADDALARIDLVSVARRRQGLGTRLFGQLFAWCAQNGLSRVEVTTEAENVPAWRFYLKNGFEPAGASCVFHFHQGEWP